MYRTGLLIMVLTGASWALVGKVTSDWQLALYTALAVLVFGGVLFWMAFRNTIAIKRPSAPARSAELPAVLSALNAKTKEFERLKSDFISEVAHQLHVPLSKLQSSTKLLLDGAYGKVSPAAEEALQQMLEETQRASEVAKNFVDTHPLTADTAEPPRSVTSIKKLKVG